MDPEAAAAVTKEPPKRAQRGLTRAEKEAAEKALASKVRMRGRAVWEYGWLCCVWLRVVVLLLAFLLYAIPHVQ